MILEHISRETGVDKTTIKAIINSADRLYKTYDIKKRTGGLRQISHPTPALKFLQRWVVRNYIAYLPVHSNVTSYRSGIGIYKNAEMHISHNYLLKMDFQNFFPSITRIDIQKLILENIQIPQLADLNRNEIELITNIVCKSGRLTIGAPSSPSISNAALFDFDNLISKESSQRKIQYSRYADDITFSTNVPNVLTDIHKVVIKTLSDQTSPRLNINEEKTIFTSKKRRRLITGLVLNSTNKISIGRKKKREIKTLCYQFSVGKLPSDKASYLSGYLSYVRSVELSFIHALQKKYGPEVIEKIIGTPLVQRKHK